MRLAFLCAESVATLKLIEKGVAKVRWGLPVTAGSPIPVVLCLEAAFTGTARFLVRNDKAAPRVRLLHYSAGPRVCISFQLELNTHPSHQGHSVLILTSENHFGSYMWLPDQQQSRACEASA